MRKNKKTSPRLRSTRNWNRSSTVCSPPTETTTEKPIFRRDGAVTSGKTKKKNNNGGRGEGDDDGRKRGTSSSWDFSKYKSEAEEELKRENKTSVDEKIQRKRREREESSSEEEEYEEEDAPAWQGNTTTREEGGKGEESDEELTSDDDDDEGDDDDDDDEDATRRAKKKKTSSSKSSNKSSKSEKKYTERAVAKDGTTFSAQSFSDLHLSRPLCRACEKLGYATPTPIQAAIIPIALTGRRDVRASANREREDGGVCVAFTGKDVAQTEERGECDTRRDNGTDERVSRAVRANDSAVGRIYERASGDHRRRVIHGKASGGVEAKTGNCRCDTG